MTTVSGTFTAVGVSSVLRVPQRGDQITVAISGTYDQEIYLERALGPDMSAWEVVKAWKVEDATVAFAMTTFRYNEIFRLNAKVDVTGTSTYSLADTDLVLQELRNDRGEVLATLKESGLVLPFDLTVAGDTSVVGSLATTGPVTSPTQGVGAVAGTGVTVVESGNGLVQKSTFTLTGAVISLVDEAGAGQAGGIKIYDFPAGNIKVLGAVINMDTVLTTPFIDTAAGDIALGTVAPASAVAFTGTDDDIMETVAVAALVSKAGPVDAQSVNDKAPLAAAGGTDSDCFLNFRVDDDVAHTTEDGTFTGIVVLTWMNLGDIT